MSKSLSIYLDLIRFLAAIVVFSAHANYERFTQGWFPFLWRVSHLGNDAVMAFFVLSGFVISYVAGTKEKTFREYFLNRFARLYSVVLPAIVITIALDHIGSKIEFSMYDGWWYQPDFPLFRIITNLFFTNQLWFTSIRLFSNGPFWSMGYEFWYYVLFAIAFYLDKPVKYYLFVLVCLFIGPKILISAPVWLLGVAVHHVSLRKKIPELIGWGLFVLSILGYLFYRLNGGQQFMLELTQSWFGEEIHKYLMRSDLFLSNYIIGTFVAINFLSIHVISDRIALLLLFIEKPIRYCASYTFTLYLLHYPLLQFFAAIFYEIESISIRSSLVLLAVILSVWAIGSVTEKRKYHYKKVFIKLSHLLRQHPNVN